MAINFFDKAETGVAKMRALLVNSSSHAAGERLALSNVILDDLDVVIDRASSVGSKATATALRARFAQLLAPDVAVTSIAGSLDALADDFDTGEEQLSQDGFASRIELERLARNGEVVCCLVIALSLLLACLITLWFGRSVVWPLDRAIAVAASIARGNLDNDIPEGGKWEAGRLLHALGTMQEILRDWRSAAQRVEYLAHHDVLTELPNRAAFAVRINASAEVAKLGGHFALLLVDLDRFKEVNDTHGHAAGDELLRSVSCRLRQCIRSEDIVARLGGDEFSVLLQNGHAASAEALAERIVRSLSEPFVIGPHLVMIGASVGIALSSTDCVVDQLYHEADMALYVAKNNGRGGWRAHQSLPVTAA